MLYSCWATMTTLIGEPTGPVPPKKVRHIIDSAEGDAWGEFDLQVIQLLCSLNIISHDRTVETEDSTVIVFTKD